MRKKYIVINVSLIILLTIILSFVGIIEIKKSNQDNTKDSLIEYTNLLVETYSDSIDYSTYDNKKYRITIIDANGDVLKDNYSSNTGNLENHSNREEFLNALNDKPTILIRYSETFKINMMYYAVKTNENTVVRVATPISDINQYLYNALPYLIISLIIILSLIVVLCTKSSKIIFEPLELIKDNLDDVNNGKYEKKVTIYKSDELNTIMNDIYDISEKMSNNINEIKKNDELLDTILNNISTGIITFNDSLELRTVNRYAKEIFDLKDEKGKSLIYLVNEKDLYKELINNIKDEENHIFIYEHNNSFYNCLQKKINSELNILVMDNITEEKLREKMRSDFFADASHELKTPLTTIIGFNEMLKLKNKDTSLDAMIDNIDKNSKRMLSLIEDMLNISKLESTVDFEKELLDIRTNVDEVISELALEINNKNINVLVDCKENIYMNKDHLHELLKNLIENAIRYNNQDGKIYVSSYKMNDKVCISVKDTGIGIRENDQKRIFERFYRVDKSRSRAKGGTGLGLSIVKHICNIYNGELILQSKIGVGTEIKILF